MKKILLYALAFVSPALLAQVTLEHHYVSSGGYANEVKSYAFFTAAGINYYTLDGNASQVKFYNASHVLYKTVTLNLGAGFEMVSLMMPTDGFFNTNPKIEFIMVYSNYQEIPGITKMTLFDEDGNNLQEFGDRFVADYIKISDTSFKLIVSQDQSFENEYDIYNAPGILSVQQQQMLTSGTNAYPNPTANRINISNPMLNGENGAVKIYSVTGAKVLEQPVNGNENTISVDVSPLSKGTYIYKINNHSGKFIKE